MLNEKDFSDEVKKKASAIFYEISQAKSILLHCHPMPDPDSVASALALKLALEGVGKKVTLIRGDSLIVAAFRSFPGIETIVEKNFTEINQADFDLFIILDSSSPNMISAKGPVLFAENLQTLVIDHHASNAGFAKLNLVDTSSPATAFIIFQLLKLWKINISREIALNLFMGMYTDTGGLKYPPTDYRVFLAAAECVMLAPDYTELIFTMENSASREAIDFEALAFSSVETFCSNSVAIASVSYEQMQKKSISLKSISGHEIANKLKSVIGWNIGLLMIEMEPQKTKVSLRCRDPKIYDLSRVALALGGGGHKAAAGLTLACSLDEAKKIVVEKIKEVYNLQ